MQQPVTTRSGADLLTALVLLALGLATIYGAWTMDRLEIRRIHPASVPGLVPGVLGLALVLCAGMLLRRAWREGGRRLGGLAADPEGARRVAAALLLTLAYPLVLIGRLPFALATALFVFGFIAWFEWDRDAAPAGRRRRLATAALQAAITGLVVALVFEQLFLVRLP